MPRAGTTLCHPKIGNVNAVILFRSRHLAVNSPLCHFIGDQRTPLHQTHKTTRWLQSSFSSNCNMVFAKLQRTQSLARPTTHAAISISQPSHNSISSQYSHCPVGWGCRIHWLHLCRGGKTTPTSVLDMTLNNLMVRFQQCWSFGECGGPLHCHRSQVHSGPEW